MTIRNTTFLAAALAAALGLSASVAQAQSHHTYTRTTTTVTRYTYRAPLTASQKEAKRLHREAVKLDHRATYEDQHGHPQLGASLARQASQLNARAFRLGHR